jgi:hypothetical protein
MNTCVSREANLILRSVKSFSDARVWGLPSGFVRNNERDPAPIVRANLRAAVTLVIHAFTRQEITANEASPCRMADSIRGS